jgi:hypothetical protein
MAGDGACQELLSIASYYQLRSLSVSDMGDKALASRTKVSLSLLNGIEQSQTPRERGAKGHELDGSDC